MDAFEQAKAYALEKTGLNWDKKDKWRDGDRVAYLAALAEFRQANSHLFTPEEMEAAANYASAAATPAPEFSYVGEFFAEAGNQVKALNDDLNPFAEANRAKTRNVAIALVLLAVAIFSAVWAFRTSPRNPNPSPGVDLFADRKPAAPKRTRRQK